MVVKITLTEYSRETSVLPHDQYGFTKGRRAQGAIAHLTDGIRRANDRGKNHLGISMGLSKIVRH